MTDFLVYLLFVLFPIDIAAALILTYLSHRNPDLLTLKERAFTAVVTAIVATAVAFLALVYFDVVALPSGVALFFLALGLVIMSMPSVYWLVLLLTGRFRIDGRKL